MSETNNVRRVVVVGGGVAGLSTAYLIREFSRDKGIDLQLNVLESKPVPGGSTRTDLIDGYTCEWGPNGFLDNEPATLELVTMLGLQSRLLPADESSSRRFIYHSGKMRELPMNPVQFLKSDILPLGSKLRMGLDYFIAAKKNDKDETVDAFGRRRLGAGFSRYLLDPMISGIFAGNTKELSLEAIFPKMVEMEKEYGGLIKALIAKKKKARKSGVRLGGPAGPGAVLHTFINGMGELTGTLATNLEKELRTSLPVRRLERDRQSFIVRTDDEAMVADAVVLACPSYESAKIIKDLAPRVSNALSEISFAPVDVVCQGYAALYVDHEVSGFGVLIPRSEKFRSLGCLWSDSIFPGQSPGGYHLLRTIIGGAHDPDVVKLSNESLSEVAFHDLCHLLNVRKEPDFEKIYRHPKGIAQYTVGHLRRVAASERLEKDMPGLYFTGASYRGVSVNGCIKDAFKVAGQFRDIGRNFG